MHYGVEHNISMELYNKSQIQATNSRDPSACTTKDNIDRRKEGKCNIECYTYYSLALYNIERSLYFNKEHFTLKVLHTAYRIRYLIP